jgi:rRNA processing protein Gar1
MPGDPAQIYDLDNIVCLPEDKDNQDLSKQVIGFISDVVGPVSMPLYSVVMYKQFTDVLSEHLGDENQEAIREFIKGR